MSSDLLGTRAAACGHDLLSHVSGIPQVHHANLGHWVLIHNRKRLEARKIVSQFKVEQEEWCGGTPPGRKQALLVGAVPVAWASWCLQASNWLSGSFGHLSGRQTVPGSGTAWVLMAMGVRRHQSGHS